MVDIHIAYIIFIKKLKHPNKQTRSMPARMTLYLADVMLLNLNTN